MEAYRDQYAGLFRNGRGVTFIGISNDSPEELASWARDAEFPFLFASDPAGGTAGSYGTGLRANLMVDRRTVIVIDPEGRISRVMAPFREIDPAAYEELRDAIAAVAPPPGEEEE
jgi:peroxiredoxin Q/BCP